ncbi:MAG: type II toxin-antitoxin system prevent-host-death family antitoxin [Methanimicrococcus sp.]|nr:type II toxin-antitoxin system prevent-host-death family antitoxin [Methanimicrococcus sp.]
MSIEIRPVTDLRYKFNEIEEAAKTKPVYLTRNGHGILVVMSIDNFSKMTNDIDSLLNEADRVARESSVRYAGDDVFKRLRERYK